MDCQYHGEPELRRQDQRDDGRQRPGIGHVLRTERVYSARGKITDEGKVKFNLDAGYVEFRGKVEGDSGDGTWNAGRCRGRFTMTRK